MLAIDDETEVLGLIQATLAEMDLDIRTAVTAAAGWELFCKLRPAIVIVDLRLPDQNGMELLQRMIAFDPSADVVLLTGYYSTSSAVEAIQKGACDYLEKPFQIERLRRSIGGLLAEAQRRQTNRLLNRELLERFECEGIIGSSPAMLEVFRSLRRLAPHFRTVLIGGPTGTGKEMVARALHHLSPQASGPLVICNCSAIVETLFETEVFGHTKGAFTGATADKVGLFEAAHEGTLFLDEIGDMPLPMQSKLLRVIQSQQVTRVGSVVPRGVNVRVIAASNRDLPQRVAEGQFREDLYFRLAAFEIHLPPLADRREDLPLLTEFFLERYAAQYGKPLRGLTRRAQAAVNRYAWPGNVRELENALANACLQADGALVDIHDLPAPLRDPAVVAGGMAGMQQPLTTLDEMQRRYAREVVARVGGNKARAAEALGISRATLYRLLSQDAPQDEPPAAAPGSHAPARHDQRLRQS